ncbi:MAG: hypothetical protein KAJ95_00480 [Gammaproteobacteria bacterium]|nr:hypothetical protein [Gammaproteobacteria bacterium]
MALKYKTESKDSYFLVTARGKNNSFEVISNYAREVTELCVQQGFRALVIDERNREYNMEELLDQYKLANYFTTLGLARVRVAIVCKPQYIDKVHFVETTANNRGLNLRYFVDLDSAKTWVL